MDINLPFEPGAHLAAYLRDSGGKRQDLSVPQQEAEMRRFCQENGFTLARIFADVARSGTTTTGRVQLDRLLAFFEDGQAQQNSIRGVLFWSYSRWARNFDDGMFALASLRRLGYPVYSLGEFVPEGPAGKAIEAFHLATAEQFSQTLSRNIKRGMRYMVTHHKAWMGHPLPFGYTTQTVTIAVKGKPREIKQVVIDPAKAPRVRRAFEMRAGGATLGEVAQETQITTTRSGLAYLFRNKLYLGTYQFGDLVVPNYCPPLVDLATWTAAQEIARQRTAGQGPHHPRRVRSTYLLSGLLRCGKCGGSLRGRTSKNKQGRVYYYYWCWNSLQGVLRDCDAYSIPMRALEERVLTVLQETLTPPVLAELFETARTLAAAGSDSQNIRLASLQTALAENQKHLDRLVTALTIREHSLALLTKLDELETQKAQLTEEIAQLEGTLSSQTATDLLDLDPADLYQEAGAVLAGDDQDAQREIIRGFVSQIKALKNAAGELTGEITLTIPGGAEQVEKVVRL